MNRRVLTSMLVVLLSLASTACGNGDGLAPASGDVPATISGINGPFDAFREEPFEIAGANFGSAGTAVTVRFTSVNGPVFQGGTAEHADVAGTIVSAGTVAGVTPVSIASGEFSAFVTVVLPDGEEILSFVPIAEFVALEVNALSLTEVASEIPQEIEITGEGFEPIGDTIMVSFESAASDFLGGAMTRLDVTGVVVDAQHLLVTTPIAGVGADVLATVWVERQDGFRGLMADAITFRAPTATASSETSAGAEEPRPFTITGVGYGPLGATVDITFTAATNAFPGPSDSVATTGTILSDTEIEGMTPDAGAISLKAETMVTLVFPSGAAATLAPDTMTFEPRPDAEDDEYDVFGNVLLAVDDADGLLDNDTDPDGDTLTVLEYDDTSSEGGQVQVEDDGAFTYDPPPGFEGTDTFEYTITDGVATQTATASLDVTGRTWFIDDTAPAGGDGRLNSPFKSLTNFNDAQGLGGDAAPAAGDTVFVFEGETTAYEGGIELLDDMLLIGEAEGLTLDSTEIVPPGDAPDLGFGGTVGTDAPGAAISLAKDNVIRGIDISNSNGGGVEGTDVGTLVIRNMRIVTLGGPALDIATGTLDVEVNSITVAPTQSPVVEAVHGIRLTAVEGTLEVTTTEATSTGIIDIKGTSEEGIWIDKTSDDLDITCLDLSVAASGKTGVLLETVAGSLVVDGLLVLEVPAPGDALVRIATSSANIRFDTVNLNGAVYKPDPLDATKSIFVHAGGDGIELIEHSGTFEIRGGLLSSFGDSAIRARACGGAITLDGTFDHDNMDGADGLTIHTTGLTPKSTVPPSPPQHGLFLDECTGNVTVKGCAFRVIQERFVDRMTSPAADLDSDNNNAIHLENTTGTLAKVLVDGNVFVGGVAVGDPVDPQQATATDWGVRIVLDGAAVISDLEIKNNEAVHNAEGAFSVVLDPDDNGTTPNLPRIGDLSISGNGSELHNQLGNIRVEGYGRSKITAFDVDDNEIDGDNGDLTGDIHTRGSGIALILGLAGGTGTGDAQAVGTINGNTLAEVGRTAAHAGIAVTVGRAADLVLELDSNNVDGQAGSAIVVQIQGTATADATVSNNALGANEGNDKATPVGPTGMLVLVLNTATLCLFVDGNEIEEASIIAAVGAAALAFQGIPGAAPYADAAVKTALEAANNTTAGGAISVVAGNKAGACTVATP